MMKEKTIQRKSKKRESNLMHFNNGIDKYVAIRADL